MTNNDIYQLVHFICQAEKTGIWVEEYQFDLLLKQCSLDRFRQILGPIEHYQGAQPSMRSMIEVDQLVTEKLRRFKIGPTPLTFTAGLATIPGDYYYPTALSVSDRPVEVLTDSQWFFRISSTLKAPTDYRPAIRFLASTVQVHPSTVASLSWTYLKLPADPVFTLKDENGIKVYDSANSTELDWDELDKIDIISMILKQFGMAITPQQVAQYQTLREQNG
jgi:hypothetical protein